MEQIDVKFTVSNNPKFTDQHKTELTGSGAFKEVGASKVTKLWRRDVPGREKVTIDVSGPAISIMDDWACTLFGES